MVPGDSRFEWKQIPPPEKKKDILLKEHDQALHMGFEKTLAKIKLRFYWPRMAQEVKQYIQKCKIQKNAKLLPFQQSQKWENRESLTDLGKLFRWILWDRSL